MKVELLTTIDQLEQLAPQWRELDSLAAVALPFSTSDWAICWWRHLAADRLSVRDRMVTLAVRDGDGRLAGVAPLMITERPSSGPLRVRCLQFIGADANVTELRTIAVRPGSEQAVYRALLERVRELRGEWDWMRWTGVADGVALDGGGAWSEGLTCWLLNLPPSWAEFKSALPRNLKESLRKAQNAPKRDGVELRFEVATRPEQMQSCLDRFFALHSARAGLTDTVRHPDVFSTPASQIFLRAVCDRFASRGVVHCFNLLRGDTIVAMRLGFRLGDSMYLYFSGYEPALAKYSVMTACVAEAIRWSLEQGVRVVNLSTGTDRAKSRWRPQGRQFRELTLVAPGARARAAHSAWSLVEHRLRHVLPRLGWRRA